MARYREEAAPAALAPFLECLWTVAADAPQPDYRILPDGCVDILFSPGFGLRAVGAMTAPQHTALPAGEQVAGLRFRPGMAGRFLGLSPREFTDTFVPLEDVWGRRGRDLRERLANTAALEHRLGALASALPEPRAGDAVFRALAALAASHGQHDLDWLARQAGVSPRQFRRRSIEEAGLSPKHLARILRFRRAVELLPTCGAADLAAECGYYDQAHLIRDFREFAGVTPRQYVSDFSNTSPPPPAMLSA